MLFSFGRCKMTALRFCAMLLFVTISNAQEPRTLNTLKNIDPDDVGDSSKQMHRETDHSKVELDSSPLARQGFSGLAYYGKNQPYGSPFGSPYKSNSQGSPYGSNARSSSFASYLQSSPYGTNTQSSLYGSNQQGSPFGSNPQSSLFGSNQQGSPFGNKPQSFPFGIYPQRFPYGSYTQGSPYGTKSQEAFNGQYAGGYSTGNMYGQYSNTFGKRMRATRTKPGLESEVNNQGQVNEEVPFAEYKQPVNDERRHIGSKTYSGFYKPELASKISGAYPQHAHFGTDDWSNSYQPKQRLQQPVTPVANFEEYICAVYNKNLLATWRMLSRLLTGHSTDSPGKEVLNNLFKLIRIYLLLHNGNASNEEKEINLKESGNILMEATNPVYQRSNRKRQPSVNSPKFSGFTAEITDAPNDDNTVGLDVVFPVPKNKCQEYALDGLVETFKKLYVQYLTHVDRCDGKHLPLL